MANKYVPVHEPSRAMASDLCKSASNVVAKWDILTAWATRTLSYDYVRAVTIPKKNGLPDVARCWRLRMGVCLDISSLVVGMLRAVGVNAYLVIGWADGRYHAWCEATIRGKTYRYDHGNPNGNRVKTYKRERMY